MQCPPEPKYVFKNATIDYAYEHPRWVVHELGHAFENATEINDGSTSKKPGRDGLPKDLLIRKLNDPSNRDDPHAGFYGPFSRWQYSEQRERGEIFADMFVGWVYNTWAKRSDGYLTDMAARRADYMEQKMPYLISLALKHR